MHFRKKNYPNWFFNKCLKKIENDTKLDSQDKEVDDYAYILGLPYFGKPSRKFASQLTTLLKQRTRWEFASKPSERPTRS